MFMPFRQDYSMYIERFEVCSLLNNTALNVNMSTYIPNITSN